jgi:hypothetical protein
LARVWVVDFVGGVVDADDDTGLEGGVGTSPLQPAFYDRRILLDCGLVGCCVVLPLVGAMTKTVRRDVGHWEESIQDAARRSRGRSYLPTGQVGVQIVILHEGDSPAAVEDPSQL